MTYTSRSIRTAALAVVLVVLLFAASLPAAYAQSGPALVSPLATGSNFNSSFNGSHSGWSRTDTLSTWIQDASHYSTDGLALKTSSIKHSGTYDNFVFQVKMRRVGCAFCANMLIVRGDPSTLSATNVWNSGYEFVYTTDQHWQIYRIIGGFEFPASLYVYSPYINSGGSWNVLKVVMYGPVHAFYMNGVLLGFSVDATYTSGAVGIGMYAGGAGQKLVVDWAKLSKIVGDPGPLPGLTPSAAITPPAGGTGYVSP